VGNSVNAVRVFKVLEDLKVLRLLRATWDGLITTGKAAAIIKNRACRIWPGVETYLSAVKEDIEFEPVKPGF